MDFVSQVEVKTANAAFPFLRKATKHSLRSRYGNIGGDSSIKLCNSTCKNDVACPTIHGDHVYKKDLCSYNIAGKNAGVSVSQMWKAFTCFWSRNTGLENDWLHFWLSVRKYSYQFQRHYYLFCSVKRTQILYLSTCCQILDVSVFLYPCRINCCTDNKMWVKGNSGSMPVIQCYFTSFIVDFIQTPLAC